jgi:DNA polymerase-3 subunit alpha
MNNKFVHLHVHSEYSLLDGLGKLSNVISFIKENEMDSIAITDHGAMYGAIEFYKKAKKADVKPIVGIETYVTASDHKIKPDKGKTKNYHLLLLAKDEEGYQNLMKITSLAHLEGYYYRPRIDHEILAKYHKGLICTSACPQGEVAQSILEDDDKKLKKIVKWYYDVFGKDYYLEIQRHHPERFLGTAVNDQVRQEIKNQQEMETKINKRVVDLSREMGIPLLATNDAHYVKVEDAPAQDALVCIATGKNVDEVKRLRFIDVPDYYLKSTKEMQSLYQDLPDALDNSVKIADKCNLEISTLGKWFFPKFPLPKKLDAAGYLRKLVSERVDQKYEKVTTEIQKRIEYEEDIIINKGYAPYFLIYMDIVNWANDAGIITNTRGSAAGSIVSYILGITTVDPIKYYLPFERFLNPFRPTPPDIDLDVADNRREEVIEYISNKYGKDKVAQICTFGRMLSRASVRDVARVLGYEYAVGDRIAKLIPPPKQGFPITIPKALKEIRELKEFYDSDENAKRILDLAAQMEGNARHLSVHAAGVVAAPSPITDFTPVQKEPSGEKIITQYEMHACEDVGLIKLDILGIRNLSTLGSAIAIVKKLQGIDIDIRNIPLNDKKTFQMLSKGDTMGTFQLSGSGMTRFLKDLGPTKIEDLMVMVALYRPGPMSVIPDYIARKKDSKLVKYLDPRMKKYLNASYGLIVYQDDLLFTAIELAGYDWVEADKFRKAVGKKIPEEMAAQKEKFTQGVVTHGQSKKFADHLWELFEPFQAYGFNKAHAASYGVIAYQTAYMKANYPVEFMCALLSSESGDKDKVSAAVHESKRMGIEVLPPDINESRTDFTIVNYQSSLEGKAIRFGLGAIKNVGEAAIQSILSERKKQEYSSYADFLARADSRKVNKKVLESLIKVGALSKFGKRSTLLSILDEVRNKVSKPKSNENQQGLFSSEEIVKSMKTELPQTIVNQQEFSDEELQLFERQLLGFSLSARPVGELLAGISHLASHKIFEISANEGLDSHVKIAAVVTEVRIIITKRSSSEMAFVKVEDETGVVDLVVFPKMFAESKTAWVDSTPVLIGGKVESRDDSSSIIVDTVQTYDQLKLKNDKLSIKIPKKISQEQLRTLRKLLINHPGNQSVSLVFEGSEKYVDLKFTISWDKNLADEINEILTD